MVQYTYMYIFFLYTHIYLPKKLMDGITQIGGVGSIFLSKKLPRCLSATQPQPLSVSLMTRSINWGMKWRWQILIWSHMTGRLGVYFFVSEGSATWLGKSIAHSLTCLVCEASFHDRTPKSAACAAQPVLVQVHVKQKVSNYRRAEKLLCWWIVSQQKPGFVCF